MRRVKKAVIPAAGFGTRFLPATKAVPKEMLPIVDKPAIQYIVEEAVESGIEEILIISGRYKESVANHFDRHPEFEAFLREKGRADWAEEMVAISELAKIHYIRQKEALGLGHAIYCAKTFVGNEPFAIMLGDDIVTHSKPCLKQLIEVFEQVDHSVLGVQTINPNHVSKYGIIGGEKLDDRLYRVDTMVEKPPVGQAPSNIAILGRYILTPEIFDALESTPPGKGGEIQLTDGMVALGKYQDIYAYDFEGRRYDTGDKLGFLKATVEFALKHPEVGSGFETYIKDLTKKL